MVAAKEKIKLNIAELGIRGGDTVFFHSSLRSIGYVPGGADTVIDSFLEILGKKGTLVLPALCKYDFENMTPGEVEKSWDIARTQTFTGLIPETFRKRAGTLRSDNPTHSVCAAGRLAEKITRHHAISRFAEEAPDRPPWASRGAFGKNSPWEKLYELDAKYMLIGVDFNVCTMLHHVQFLFQEELGKEAGPAPWPSFNFMENGRKLEKMGAAKTGMIGNSPVKLIGSRSLVDSTLAILRRENQ